MAGVGFDDILQQAEQLFAGLDGGNELPHVHRNFQQLIDAGNRFSEQTSSSQDNDLIKTSLLLSARGHEVPRVSEKIKNLAATGQNLEPLEPIVETDIESFLRNERENAILAVVEEQKNKTFEQVDQMHWSSRLREWEAEKQALLSKIVTGDKTLSFTGADDHLDVSAGISISENVRSNMNSWEISYAKQMSIYNDKTISGSITANLWKLCQSTADEMKEESISMLWNMVSCVIDHHYPHPDKTPSQRRNSKSVLNSLVLQARRYLEDSYKSHIQACIQFRPHTAKLGGRPGTENLIKAYLNVRPIPKFHGYEDDSTVFNWAVFYYCLRCGDLDQAVLSACNLDPDIPELSNLVSEYAHDNFFLSSTSRNKLHLQYKRSMRNDCNPYKSAALCVLGRFNVTGSHPTVIEKTDDYLWIKLCQLEISSHAQPDSLTLIKLQNLLEEFGESHFDASNNPLVYFQVLFLTCQFEAAIEFLSRFPALRCHAVHIALTLNESDLLVTSSTLHEPLLSARESNEYTVMQQINLTRLLLMYTRKFELSDPKEALNYLYFLKNEKHQGKSLFIQCTSELVQETGEFAMLLGNLNPDGSRKAGAVDKYCKEDTKELISTVAKHTEDNGLFEDALLLYDLCGEYDKTICLLNRLLSPVVSCSDQSHSDRLRLKALAVQIAQRYKKLAVETSRDIAGTFHFLLDTMSFFDAYHEQNFTAAKDILDALRILPLKDDQVQTRIRAFASLGEEVRRSIGDILLAAMTILSYKAKNIQTRSPSKVSIQSQARAMLTFAGMLPYQLPGNITSKLVKLEVDLS